MFEPATGAVGPPHDKYDRLIATAKNERTIKVAVAHPCDEVSLRRRRRGETPRPDRADPCRARERLRGVAAQGRTRYQGVEIVASEHSHDSAAKAVELVARGKVEALMKGSLHTDELMGAVVAQTAGIRTARRISHCFIMDVPGHADPLIITDAAVNIAPDPRRQGRHRPERDRPRARAGHRQAAGGDPVGDGDGDPKVPSTIEAAALCKMAERGQITGALLDGPLALDNAISPEAAAIKHIVSPVAGRANVLVVPDLEAGNMLAKSLSFLAGAEAAGIVLGARVPIILTSRADSLDHPPRLLRGGRHGRSRAAQIRAASIS